VSGLRDRSIGYSRGSTILHCRRLVCPRNLHQFKILDRVAESAISSIEKASPTLFGNGFHANDSILSERGLAVSKGQQHRSRNVYCLVATGTFGIIVYKSSDRWSSHASPLGGSPVESLYRNLFPSGAKTTFAPSTLLDLPVTIARILSRT
jgi:hypothetical protein